MGFLKKSVTLIVNFLSNICYIFIFIYALVCTPMLFGEKPLVVLSGSMEPSYKVGSIIYYHEPKNNDEIEVGKAITFKGKDENASLISHRVYSIDNGVITTKGDANSVVDQRKLSYDEVVGIDSEFCVPFVGYYVRYVNEHRIVVWIAVIILVSEFLLSNVETFGINKSKKGEIEA